MKYLVFNPLECTALWYDNSKTDTPFLLGHRGWVGSAVYASAVLPAALQEWWSLK